MCEFCEAYDTQNKIYSFKNNHPEYYEEKMFYEITVAMVIRTWTKSKGKAHAGRTTDYRFRGLGYKLNYCPECGRKL